MNADYTQSDELVDATWKTNNKKKLDFTDLKLLEFPSVASDLKNE